MITDLDELRNAVSEDKLFERAVNDAIEALMRRATLGRSLTDATTQLDRWRQLLEKANR